MRFLRSIIFLFLCSAAFGQSTTITGTIRDLSNALVTSGQVSFELQPGIDTTISGTARFVPSTLFCTITGAGLVKALDGVSACTVIQNTALSPANTSWKACIQPGFVTPGSCLVFYAVGSTVDISAVAPTPAQLPAYHLIDDFSNQTVAGNKNFTGNITFGGSLTMGAIVLGGSLTANNGGSLGGIFSGNPTLSGNILIGGTLGVSGAVSGPSFSSTTANPATSGFEKLARIDQVCWRNAANSANVCLFDAGAASSATGGFADNLQWGGGAFQAAAFVGGGTPAGSGVLNVSNNVCAVAAENSLANGDICAVKVNGSNQTVIPSASLASPTSTGTDSGAETLISKVLLGGGVSNSVTLISACKFDNSAAVAGNGATPVNIFSCTFPANTLPAGKCFHTQGSWQHTTGTAGVTYIFTYGSATQSAAADALTGVVTWALAVCNKSGVTNAQTITGIAGFDGITPIFGNIFLAGANDTTTGITLKFTFTVAATDQVTPLQMITWLDQ